MGTRIGAGTLRAAAYAALAAAVLCWLGLTGFAWNDYDMEASSSVAALLAGDVTAFLVEAPAYGGSLILRAPFALLADGLGGGELAVYRALSIPCVGAVALLAARVAAGMAPGPRLGGAALVAVLFVANPIALFALELGHPEELLGAALCVAAVLAALRGSPALAGLLLGLAFANKAWAVLAAGPVLLALDRGRVRAAVVAAAAAAAVLAPLALAGESRSLAVATATTGSIFKPWHVWWFFGEPGVTIQDVGGALPGYRAAPEWLAPVTRPLTVAFAGALSVAWLVRRRARHGAPQDALLLLALIFLARCLLDPWNNGYYGIGALLALLTWEARATTGPPVRSLLVVALSWMTFSWLNEPLSADESALSYLLWAVPLAAWMAARLYGRRTPLPRPAAEPGAAPAPA